MSMYILSLNVSIIVYLQIKYTHIYYLYTKKEYFLCVSRNTTLSELLYELIFTYTLSNIYMVKILYLVM